LGPPNGLKQKKRGGVPFLIIKSKSVPNPKNKNSNLKKWAHWPLSNFKSFVFLKASPFLLTRFFFVFFGGGKFSQSFNILFPPLFFNFSLFSPPPALRKNQPPKKFGLKQKIVFFPPPIFLNAPTHFFRPEKTQRTMPQKNPGKKKKKQSFVPFFFLRGGPPLGTISPSQKTGGPQKPPQGKKKKIAPQKGPPAWSKKKKTPNGPPFPFWFFFGGTWLFCRVGGEKKPLETCWFFFWFKGPPPPNRPPPPPGHPNQQTKVNLFSPKLPSEGDQFKF